MSPQQLPPASALSKIEDGVYSGLFTLLYMVNGVPQGSQTTNLVVKVSSFRNAKKLELSGSFDYLGKLYPFKSDSDLAIWDTYAKSITFQLSNRNPGVPTVSTITGNVPLYYAENKLIGNLNGEATLVDGTVLPVAAGFTLKKLLLVSTNDCFFC